MWLVDWDLPKEEHVNRVRLWRKIQDIKKRLNGDTLKYSSWSVIISSSEQLAQEIHQAAKALGAKSSLYALEDFKLVSKYRGRRKTTQSAKIET